MLDIKYIRKYPEKVKESCRKRGVNVDIDRLLEVDKLMRKQKQKIEKMKAISNKISKVISIEKEMNILLENINKNYFFSSKESEIK